VGISERIVLEDFRLDDMPVYPTTKFAFPWGARGVHHGGEPTTSAVARAYSFIEWAVVDRSLTEAVLITGVYGSGKTSVVEEMADILEHRHVPYGALDLDWLGWFDVGQPNHAAGMPVMLQNLTAVVNNYLGAGVRRFVVAGACGTADDIEALRAVLAMPLTVVRLEVPRDEVRRRLSGSATAGRQDDLRVAEEWFLEGRGVGIEDMAVDNTRPLRTVALDIVSALGW
jgi:hypothetical protein